MDQTDPLLQATRAALEPFPELAFAVLFGSAVIGRLRADSDLDVAVYLASGRSLEIESERELTNEADMMSAIERLTDRNVDLLILNRAPATVCAAAVLTGVPALIRDKAMFSRYRLAVTDVAIDFWATEREFRLIRARSASLNQADRARLERILDYMAEELRDREQFAAVTLQRYEQDRNLRRNFDRWTEVLITAVIDLGKIVLASEHRPTPQTYSRILEDLESCAGFTHLQGRLKPLAALRNILAHEYIDLRFSRLATFAREQVGGVAEAADAAQAWMERVVPAKDATPPENAAGQE